MLLGLRAREEWRRAVGTKIGGRGQRRGVRTPRRRALNPWCSREGHALTLCTPRLLPITCRMHEHRPRPHRLPRQLIPRPTRPLAALRPTIHLQPLLAPPLTSELTTCTAAAYGARPRPKLPRMDLHASPRCCSSSSSPLLAPGAPCGVLEASLCAPCFLYPHSLCIPSSFLPCPMPPLLSD